MSRIKCPNCGSSTQVEPIWIGRDSYSITHIREYECCCGCHFEVTFEVKTIKILEENT